MARMGSTNEENDKDEVTMDSSQETVEYQSVQRTRLQNNKNIIKRLQNPKRLHREWLIPQSYEALYL